MTAARLYGDLAWIWPYLSPPADYVAEGRDILGLLRRHASGPVRTLLDLGCGGGHNDHGLGAGLAITGIDLSPAMLAHARRLNPAADYREGDMRTVRLGERFDAVGLFDAVSYMLSESDLAAAFATAHAHLRPGGVFLTFAEVTAETFVQNALETRSFAAAARSIAFIEHNFDPDPADSSYETTYILLIRDNGGQRIETDTHRCGLFPLATWRRLLAAAGFAVVEPEPAILASYLKTVRVFVGRKPMT